MPTFFHLSNTFVLTLLVLALSGPANAGPSEDAAVVLAKADNAAALSLWRPLAGRGDANAQLNLGVMYYNGTGVAQDYMLAGMWFSLAASQFPEGELRDPAVENRDTAAALLTPTQLSEAQSLIDSGRWSDVITVPAENTLAQDVKLRGASPRSNGEPGDPWYGVVGVEIWDPPPHSLFTGGGNIGLQASSPGDGLGWYVSFGAGVSNFRYRANPEYPTKFLNFSGTFGVIPWTSLWSGRLQAGVGFRWAWDTYFHSVGERDVGNIHTVFTDDVIQYFMARPQLMVRGLLLPFRKGGVGATYTWDYNNGSYARIGLALPLSEPRTGRTGPNRFFGGLVGSQRRIGGELNGTTVLHGPEGDVIYLPKVHAGVGVGGVVGIEVITGSYVQVLYSRATHDVDSPLGTGRGYSTLLGAEIVGDLGVITSYQRTGIWTLFGFGATSLRLPGLSTLDENVAEAQLSGDYSSYGIGVYHYMSNRLWLRAGIVYRILYYDTLSGAAGTWTDPADTIRGSATDFVVSVSLQP